ncbi:MAG TPA: DUF3788 family protein [Candidatus Limnocylindrales bacterium]|jgi:hypothetical protein|nr:DUF3788 family protein [Candidatus Limnocylindrales bacterium]
MTMGAWRRWVDHPTPEQLSEHMSEHGLQLWQSLRGWLLATYGLRGEIAWTDEDAGWVLRYRRNGRSLVTLFPTADGGWSALVVLGPSLWGAVDDLALSDSTWEAFSFATPYADGRWLYLRVADAQTVGDIRRLVALKAPPYAASLERQAGRTTPSRGEPTPVG